MSDAPIPVSVVSEPPPPPPTPQQLADLALAGANAVLSAPPGAEPAWAKPAVAIFAMVLLGGVVVYAGICGDKATMLLCVGAIISMATGAGNYYLGSSSGSSKKTDLLAASPAIPNATVAVPPVVVKAAP